MSEKKKIIRVTTADISLEGLLRGQLHFLNQYYDLVGLASDTGVLQFTAEREGIRVIDVPMHREISLKADVRSLRDLYGVFRRERPWMVHANTPKGSLLAMTAAWLARVPRRVYTVTGLRYQGAQGLFRLILKTMERITCLMATNVIPEGQGVLHALQADHITRKKLAVIHYGNINGKDTRHLSQRQTVAEMMNKDYGDVSDDDIRKMRDELRASLATKAINPDDSQAKEDADGTPMPAGNAAKTPVGADDFVFVFIGRMVVDKGMCELAKAMQHICSDHPNVHLLLLGNMEKGDAIPDDVRQYFLDDKNVIYAGPQYDIRPWLLAADALVFPSYREGFPNVPMEAGAMGLASIVTNINGANEIIKDGLNGKIILAPLDNSGRHTADITPALEDTMRWFVTHPADVRRMAANAPAMIHERYEQKDVWQALLAYYKSLE